MSVAQGGQRAGRPAQDELRWSAAGGRQVQPDEAAGFDNPRHRGSGDGSAGARGTFFEGTTTRGFGSAEVEAAVQVNIVAAGYGRAP